QIEPDHAAAHFLLGVVQAKEKQPDEAVKQFQQVLRISPENVEAIYLLGQTYQQQNKATEAAAQYERLVELKPEHLGARYRLGFLRQREGKPGQAAEQYRKVLEHTPNNLAVANSLAWILATSDDPQLRNANEALDWARKCAKATDHKQVGILLTLAAACAEAGQFEEAQKWQAKAIQLAPAAAQKELQSVLELYKASKPYREKKDAQPAPAP
ncbi:unnamed protein product, partial [marine sediment metagenome]